MITRTTDLGREVVIEAADVRGRGFYPEGKNLALDATLAGQTTHLVLEEDVVDAIHEMRELSEDEVETYLDCLTQAERDWLLERFYPEADDDDDEPTIDAEHDDHDKDGVIEEGHELLVRILGSSFADVMTARALYECIRRHGLDAVVGHLSTL